MNHDYAHCLDWKPTCPKKCFRAMLVQDLEKRNDLREIPMSWMHFKGTDECPKAEKCQRQQVMMKTES